MTQFFRSLNLIVGISAPEPVKKPKQFDSWFKTVDWMRHRAMSATAVGNGIVSVAMWMAPDGSEGAVAVPVHLQATDARLLAQRLVEAADEADGVKQSTWSKR